MGMPLYWVVVVKRGKILMEIEGLPEELAKAALGIAAHKLPFKTRFVSRKKY
jgi:large subunit ribosomal protein L16